MKKDKEEKLKKGAKDFAERFEPVMKSLAGKKEAEECTCGYEKGNGHSQVCPMYEVPPQPSGVEECDCAKGLIFYDEKGVVVFPHKIICTKCQSFKPSGNAERVEEWEEEWDSMYESKILNQYGSIFEKAVKSFIKRILQKQKEEWQKEQSGWDKLKQCPQCHTMKAFTTKVCFRCLDRNEAHQEEKDRIIEEVKKMRKETESIESLENMPMNQTNITELVKRACDTRQNKLIDAIIALLKK